MPSPTPSPQPAVSPDDDRERLAQLFEQAPSLMAMLRKPEHRIAVEQGLTLGEAVPYEKEYYREDGNRW